MPWIESHFDVGDHPKTHNLMKQLDISCYSAVGLLHLLWHYTVKVSWEFGDLSNHSDQAIARACWWEGDPTKFVKALHDSGFMQNGVVHDWVSYARELIYQRQYSKRRRTTADKQVKNSCKTPFFQGSPNQTKPNQTNQTTDIGSTNGQVSRFYALWGGYPQHRRGDEAEAFAVFNSSIVTEADFSACMSALKNYLESTKEDNHKYTKELHRFLVQWRNWISPKKEDPCDKAGINPTSAKVIARIRAKEASDARLRKDHTIGSGVLGS